MQKPVPQIDQSWTLFLDRDGVLNRKIDHDYVRNWSQFDWLPGVKEALAYFATRFGKIVIVTNQRGVGRGWMTLEDLNDIHTRLKQAVTDAGGRIDGIYFCTDTTDEGSTHRKPKPGMAMDAKGDFPAIDFSKSIIAGDSGSDIQFGKNLGMYTVLIAPESKHDADLTVPGLAAFARLLQQND
ncbi:MAG TPA: HAD family hydrolase [Chitinophagales bacterium]|nr:HAD family hydrolase [Chitinophagales bacterium]HMX04211.1 HAD family hydrolase [Chitinophagales bacterium]HMZ87860.1 HAD family hydrolase [Chitinophagales bacterium]HNA56532.1 HAD family hydrolase [Chitinophagales bacterium]HNE46129.1 HAD family hydrolase [Chitinophagales bacterium]